MEADDQTGLAAVEEQIEQAAADLWGITDAELREIRRSLAAGALSGEMDPAVTGGLTWLSLGYSLWEGFMGTAMVIVTLVWCRDHFDRQGRLLRSMSAASYAVYVLHPLIIVPLAIALSGLRLDLSLKFLLVAPLAVALCFLVGHLVRKLPVVRDIL